MIDLGRLLTSVAADAIGLRKKRGQRALGFLGGRHPQSFLNTSSLLGLAGLAVGAYQIFKDKSARPAAQPVVPGTTVVDGSGRSFEGFAPPATPQSGSPLAGGFGSGRAPLGPAPAGGAPAADELALRAVRVMIAAARCDGDLGEEELGRMVSHARDLGLEEEMRREWQTPRPLAELCAGVTDPAHKRDLYVLAYTVLRADDEINGAERVFIAGLGSRLGFTPDEAAAIERDTARRIDSFS